ncbi:MAG: hypothetical protein KGQ36_06275 [Rickettsiales bacterium]|nr:hypothetical protein [Rickettsiales bacterium]
MSKDLKKSKTSTNQDNSSDRKTPSPSHLDNSGIESPLPSSQTKSISTPEYGNSTTVTISAFQREATETLSTKIVDGLFSQGFNTIIFDFDGTITRSHTAENICSIKEYYDRANSWFADKDLLQNILEKGSEKGMTFHIASKQGADVINAILECSDLKRFFEDRIFDRLRNKTETISRIAAQTSVTKALYLDDNYEERSYGDKVIIVPNVLQKIEVSDNPLKRKADDLDKHEGLTSDAWQEILSKLQQKEIRDTEKPSVSSKKSSSSRLVTGIPTLSFPDLS